MRRRIPGWLLAGLLAAGLAAQQKKQPEIDLQSAIRKEMVDGDLRGAIRQYGAIVAKYPRERAVAAQALVRMAECHRKMGDKEARSIYERVLREYADQKEAAALARAQIGQTLSAARGSGIVTRQVWTGPGVDILGRVTPDGSYLSFVDWSTGNLAVHDLATGENRLLTRKKSWAESSEFAEESAVSRDGKQVAYGWFNSDSRYDIRILDVNGESQPRILFGGPDVIWAAPYDWSPDAKWIAVQAQRRDNTSQVALLSSRDGSLRVLKSVDSHGANKMVFSPDGKYIAYDLPESPAKPDRDVFLMPVDGGPEIRVITHPANDVVLGWTPESSHLLFASDRAGSMGAWALPVSAGKPQGEPVLIKPDIGRPWEMGMTRSGALYYGVQTAEREVYLAGMDFPAGKAISPPSRLFERRTNTNRHPDWSRDGKSMVYLSRPDPLTNRNTGIAIRSLETNQVRELAPGMIWIDRPRLSPDGKYVAVQGAYRTSNGLFRVDAQTGEVAPLVVTGSDGSIQMAGWSANGQTCYYRRYEPQTRELVVVARELASGRERELLRRRGDGGAEVSPDDRTIAYVDRKSLLVAPVSGGEPRELFRDDAIARLQLITWSPDSQFVFVRKVPADVTQDGDLLRVPVAGGPLRKIDLGVPGVRDFRIHPDGKRVAFAAGEPRYEVWVMENFLQALAVKR